MDPADYDLCPDAFCPDCGCGINHHQFTGFGIEAFEYCHLCEAFCVTDKGKVDGFRLKEIVPRKKQPRKHKGRGDQK